MIVIYCRISQDRPRKGKGVLADTGKGVAEQERLCRELAEARGWSVGEVFVDNDRSAWSRKPRPEFERMLQGVADGRITRILVWSTDRLYRRVADLVRITEALDKRATVHAVVESDVDLSTADGVMVANIRGAVAQAESDRKSERVKLAVGRRIREGGYNGGVRPYGYTADGLQVVPEEATAIRKAVKDLLDGRRTLAAVARTMPPRTEGRAWSPSHVRSMLLAPRLAGHACHNLDRAQVAARKSGTNVAAAIFDSIVGAGAWPAILDDDDWRRVVVLLTDPKRRSNVGRGSKPVHLLSGIATCAVCRAPMRMSTASRKGQAPRSYYRCPVGGHARRSAAELEAWVIEQTVTKLDALLVPPPVDEPGAGPDPAAELDRLRAKLTRIDQDYDDDVIDRDRWMALNASTKAKIAELTVSAVDLPSESPVVTRLRRHAKPSIAWQSMDLDARRSVLSDLWSMTVAPYPQVNSDEGRLAYWEAKSSPCWGVELTERI